LRGNGTGAPAAVRAPARAARRLDRRTRILNSEFGVRNSEFVARPLYWGVRLTARRPLERPAVRDIDPSLSRRAARSRSPGGDRRARLRGRGGLREPTAPPPGRRSFDRGAGRGAARYGPARVL